MSDTSESSNPEEEDLIRYELLEEDENFELSQILSEDQDQDEQEDQDQEDQDENGGSTPPMPLVPKALLKALLDMQEKHPYIESLDHLVSLVTKSLNKLADSCNN